MKERTKELLSVWLRASQPLIIRRIEVFLLLFLQKKKTLLASSHGGQPAAEATCIREHEQVHEPFFVTVRGAQCPDLTYHLYLQRLAAVTGQPFITTDFGRGRIIGMSAA